MANDANEVRRRIAFDTETYLALDRLAKDRMASLQDLRMRRSGICSRSIDGRSLSRTCCARASASSRPTTITRPASGANPERKVSLWP
jgi:hypothetical protein